MKRNKAKTDDEIEERNEVFHVMLCTCQSFKFLEFLIFYTDEQQRLCHVLQTSFIRSEEDQRRVLLALESPVLSPEEWKRNRSRPKDSTYSKERKPRRLSDNTYLSFRSEGKRESQQKVAKDHTGFQEDYPSTAETK
ncbi:hypothetical protein PoB_005327400 [Plakobranchus ocellatus]|uniref:Uncharacterized protein n=1 Tax=Plakobranchus ocellatus TaxID=259542 RepID=A0AAV4C6S1_9GAST|nr:hypothetical protein PoB_005327400 [Plakobranchus ocellatus]